MKRAKKLFPILISEENLMRAVVEVNRSHHYDSRGHVNRTTLWVERTKQERVEELRQIICQGFQPKPAQQKRRYDPSAGKWRDIWEPALWPDQYVHHALVQVLQPVMMRGMDYWCCGSIRGRGGKRGMRGIRKWMRTDTKGTRYAAELDIHHFYESLRPDVVMNRMRQLVKDHEVLDLIERLVSGGIMIGAYFSQWFANTVLQPLDHLIRESGVGVTHYVRYMDNFTLYARSKKALTKAIKLIAEWLNSMGLALKRNWQKYRVDKRMTAAMGYRFDHQKVYLRKRNLLRLKRQLTRAYKRLDAGMAIMYRMAAGLLSRIGQLKHCDSQRMRRRLVRPGLVRLCKKIVRDYDRARKERTTWTTLSLSLAS